MFSVTAKFVKNPYLPTTKYHVLKLLDCADLTTFYIECENCCVYNKHTDKKSDDCICEKCNTVLRATETIFFVYMNV